MKQPRNRRIKISLVTLAVLFTAAGSLTLFGANQTVRADEYDVKIKALEAEVAGYNDKARELSEQADSLQTAVDKLQNDQNRIQAEIDLNSAKRDDLVQQITDNEAKLKTQSEVLANTLVDLYYDSQTTPLEIMASSKSLGDFVDQQTQHDAVRDQVALSAKQIKKLKSQLEQQKVQVEQILKDQNERRDQLSAKKNEQADLLATTQGEEDNYRNLMKDRNSQIDKLRAEQRAANARKQNQYGGQVVPGDPNRGGYPSIWALAPQDSLVDSWGMYNRECVSYTAWKVSQTYGNMPYWGGRGNANQWPRNADNAGIPRGSTPKVGSVGVMMTGYYGHVVWVEQVSGSKVYVSQYNWSVAGEYSEMWIDTAAFDTFIYFGG
jgi:surface antigen